jgi:hypothetical protein
MENNIPKKEAIEKNCLLYSSLNERTSMMTKTLWAETYWASDFRISVIGSFIKFPLMKYLVWSGSYFLY